MSPLPLVVKQTGYVNKAFWRNPGAAFFTVAFPLMFLVIFNLLFGNEEIPVPGGRAKMSNFYVPAITAFAVISASFTYIAMGISVSRDAGILKRIRGTPLPPGAYMAARILHAILIAFLLTAVGTIGGALFYGVDVPTDSMPALIVTVLVGAAAFSALGLAVAGFVPNAEAAPAVVNGIILPLLFISDVYISDTGAPEWLRVVAKVFPVKHFSEALQVVFSPLTAGSGFSWDHLAVIAAWGVVGVVIATRYFSWEPRR